MEQPVPYLINPRLWHKDGCSRSVRMVIVVDFHGIYFYIYNFVEFISFCLHMCRVNNVVSQYEGVLGGLLFILVPG